MNRSPGAAPRISTGSGPRPEALSAENGSETGGGRARSGTLFRLKLSLRTAAALAIVGAILTVPRDLLEERLSPAERGHDRVALLRAVALVVFPSEWIVAGLDVGRFHWADTVPMSLRVAGLSSLGAVFSARYRAMRVNPLFSAAVRVLRGRGHRAISSGPYSILRHPGDAALVLLGWGGPLAFGSWWAVLPHVAVIVLFVRRTALEDRALPEELEGYRACGATVRYRMLPGVR